VNNVLHRRPHGTEWETVPLQQAMGRVAERRKTTRDAPVMDRLEGDGRGWQCTLCYDRLKEDMTPACAKACPTESTKFGDLDELLARIDAWTHCMKKVCRTLISTEPI